MGGPASPAALGDPHPPAPRVRCWARGRVGGWAQGAPENRRVWRGAVSPLGTWPPMLPHLKHLHSPGQRGGLGGPQGEEEIQRGLPGPSPQGLARLRGGGGGGLRLLSLVAGILDEALPPPDEAWGLWGQMRQLPLPSAGPTEPGTQLQRRACRGRSGGGRQGGRWEPQLGVVCALRPHLTGLGDEG